MDALIDAGPELRAGRPEPLRLVAPDTVRPRSFPAAADVAAAAVVAGIAAAVRLPGLRPPSLWVDDVAPTLVIKAHGLRELLLVGTTYPGFVALLKGWLAVLGFSDVHALLLPFFGGVLACVVLYAASVRHGLPRLSAFVAAVLLATSPAIVTYSTRVKPYALEVLAAAVVLATSAQLLETGAGGRHWAWAIAACAGGTMLSGLVAVVAVPAIATAFVAALRGKHGRRAATTGTAFYCAFLVVWWMFVLRRTAYQPLRSIWHGSFVDIHDVTTVGRAVVRTLQSLSGVTPAVLGGLVLVGVWCVARRGPLYLGLLAGPFVVALLLAAAGRAPIGTRGNLALLPGLAVLAGIGAEALFRPLVSRDALLKPAVATAIAVPLVALVKPIAYPAEDIKPLLAPMRASAQEEYGVVVSSASALAFGLYANLPLRIVKTPEWFRVRISSPGLYVLPRYEAGPAPVAAAIETVERAHTRIWFVVSHGQPGDRDVVRQLARDGFVPTQTLRADGAFAMRWDRRIR